MKPDDFAERITRPAGRSVSIAASTVSNSSITSEDSVLALASARSNSSQATPSASRVSLKFL
ncbi:DNA-binding ferritin-like protein [Bradyrhizobium sp. LB7.1]